VAAALAVYTSALIDYSSNLAPGEASVVACISPTREQARIVQRYALGFLRTSPELVDEIESISGDEITLKNGNVIATLSADYRTMRGRTLILAILDEASFLRDESSSTPDIEAARAIAGPDHHQRNAGHLVVTVCAARAAIPETQGPLWQRQRCARRRRS